MYDFLKFRKFYKSLLVIEAGLGVHMTESDKKVEIKLKRELRLLEATAIGIGTVVGSGVVKLPGVLAGMLGNAQVIAWILGGVLCTLVALCFAKLSSVITRCGGPYVYCSAAFGRLIGFIVAWAYWIGLTMAIGALALFAADSLGIVLNISEPSSLTFLALVILVVLTTFNIIGVKVSGIIQDILTILKVGIWVAFVICGIPVLRPSGIGSVSVADFRGIISATLIAIWAYLGFEEVTVPTEEMKKPKKDAPIAVIITILFATALYISVSLVASGILGVNKLASYGKRGVEMAARALWGELGGTLFSIFMICSITAVMNGILLANSRLLFAFSRDGLLTYTLVKVHKKFRTPWIAIIVQALIAATVIIFFTTIAEVLSMIDFVLLVPHIFVSLSLLKLSLRPGGVNIKAGIRLPGEKVIALVASLLSLMIMANFASDFANIKAISYGLGAMLLGVPFYLASKGTR